MKRVFLIFLLSTLFGDKVYIGLQMLDQVGIVDSETLQLEQTIDTDFNHVSCMNYTDEISCDLMDGC